jgi:hypothetical protein
LSAAQSAGEGWIASNSAMCRSGSMPARTMVVISAVRSSILRKTSRFAASKACHSAENRPCFQALRLPGFAPAFLGRSAI